MEKKSLLQKIIRGGKNVAEAAGIALGGPTAIMSSYLAKKTGKGVVNTGKAALGVAGAMTGFYPAHKAAARIKAISGGEQKSIKSMPTLSTKRNLLSPNTVQQDRMDRLRSAIVKSKAKKAATLQSSMK